MKYFYRIVAVLMLCSLAGMVMFLYRIKPDYENKGKDSLIGKKEDSILDTKGTEVFNDNEVLRVLVLGVDKTATKQLSEEKNGMRSDTIMLFSIDPANNRVQLLSVPRDSYIRIHGYDKNKINAAFSDIVYPKGGLNLVAATVEDLLDVKIDHYALIDYKAVTQIVDAVGGMDVEWDRPDYTYKDDWVVPPLEISMKRGINHLDGKKAVDYLRIRKAYEGQDIDRIGAQQGFLMMLFDKLKSPSMILKIPELLDIVDEFVETDLTYGQMVTLARFGLGVDREDISTATLEGTNVNGVKIGRDKVSVYKVDENYAKEVVLRGGVVESEEDEEYIENENNSRNSNKERNLEKTDKNSKENKNDKDKREVKTKK